MKTLLVLAAMSLTLSAHAAPDYDPDWSVISAGSGKIYTILPGTVRAVTDVKNPYIVVVGEFRNGAQGKPERFKIAVTGCEKIEIGGSILFATLDEKTVLRKDSWVDGGGRVYDILAVGACSAYITSQSTPMPAPRPEAPQRPNGGLKTI